MDFIEGLPFSRGKTIILVVLDGFTKYGHFIALSHHFSTYIVANIFNNTYTLHGIPQSMVAYRDSLH